jgi:tetratricopeptide (TPR) repeat protein
MLMNFDLTIALDFHLAGRYADAARCYHGLLAREPQNAEALHLFGVMHHQCGYSSRAVELIGRAVALRPGAASFYSNMAEAHRSLGQYEQAAECCQAALRLQPDDPEALNNLGLALQSLGRLDEAADQFRAAIRVRPGFGLALNNLGTLMLDRGEEDEAFDAFRSAVAIDPGVAESRANLGQMLVNRGEIEEGLTHCEEAVRLRPDFAAGYNNLGNAFRALNRWPEAQAAYAESVRLAPDLPKVHVNRGLAFRGDGKFREAAASFQAAVALAPDEVAVWQSLASAHAADEDYAAAIPCCERLLQFQPDCPQWHNDLGWALQQEGRYEEAAECYRRALERQSDMLDTLMNWGSLHEVLGDFAEAEACYRQAQEQCPAVPRVQSALAHLLRGRLPDEDRQAIVNRLDDPGLHDNGRIGLLFGLAQVSDAREDYARAAECLDRANSLALEQNRKLGRRYEPAEHERFVSNLIGSFTPELFARLAGAGDETQQPIFVFGMPRSGTTLVEQILASHSRVHAAGELRLARETFEQIPTVVDRDRPWPDCLAGLDDAEVAELAQRHLEQLEAIVEREPRDSRPDRVVDKMPDNYMYLGMISLLFPCATLIHVRRDPRDIALSCWMTNFRSIRWANDLHHLAGRFEGHRRLTDHWRAVLPGPIFEVAYEDLVDDFATQARRLVQHCGLDWEPACLEFHRTSRPVHTASVTQVRQPLYRRSVARWKHYESSLKALFDRLPAHS